MRRICCSLMVVCLGLCALAWGDEAAPSVGAAQWDADRGVWRHAIKSPCQKGQNAIEVLLPREYDKTKAVRVIYVLPVETGIGGRWGDGLMEIKKLGLHDVHGVVCVTMSFDTIPWYMDHATDPAIRQETYLRQVVEIVEARYKTPGDRTGRLLLGFSKSGWGATAMLLRHPDFYGCAAAWDAPLMLREEDWKSFGIPQACGTRERFAQYRLADLVTRAADSVKTSKRLAILGEKNFGSDPGKKYAQEGHTLGFHKLLEQHKVPHLYRDDLKVDHHWNTGWVKGAVEALMEMSGR